MERPGNRTKLVLLGLLCLVGIGIAFALDPVPQNPDYHRFADERPGFGVSNVLNVLSNLPFLLIGGWGLVLVYRLGREGPVRRYRAGWERLALALFAVSLLGVAFGSSWYHLAPDSGRLVWDRLPMAVGFMSLVALVLGERIGSSWGRRLLGPLVLLGVGSVLHWHLGEQRGAGDLRLYGLVQFLPMLLIPLLVALFPSPYTRGGGWIVALGWYGLAKGAEALDRAIYAWGVGLSGHTLKHLFAAVGVAWILRMVARRRLVVPEEGTGSVLGSDAFAGPFGDRGDRE